jgi:hypothetical protein
MELSQAVVAIGGRASRIRRDGYPVSISKSFISVHGQPLLYWNLKSLQNAGITNIILCADRPVQVSEAKLVLGRLSRPFKKVEFFQDLGLGVHGLPYQVIREHPGWLDDSFIFECGHSLMPSEHYLRLMDAKMNNNVVFTAFTPHPSNERQPVILAGESVILLAASEPGCRAIAHPIVADRRYAARLPLLSFDINQIINYHSSRASLKFVSSSMPPEFDLIDELCVAMPLYDEYIETSLQLLAPRHGHACSRQYCSGHARPAHRHSRRGQELRRLRVALIEKVAGYSPTDGPSGARHAGRHRSNQRALGPPLASIVRGG